MKKEIPGYLEDKIYDAKRFINKLQSVCYEEHDKIFKELTCNLDDFYIEPDKLEDYFFDYVFNEEEELTFEEYLWKLIPPQKD